MSITVVTVVGARPQFVKAAPVSQALAAHPDMHEVMVHTGQHHDAGMSDIFFSEFGLPPPRHHLGVHGGSHAQMTARMLEGLDPILAAEQPEWVLVYGDTNSTLAGALCAAKRGVRVAHVEAGLRSFDRSMPEEVNRVLTDHLSSLLFCPTRRSVDNLGNEGIISGVHLVGDVMYDAVLLQRAHTEPTGILERFGVEDGGFAIATVHRAGTVDDPERLDAVIDYLNEQSQHTHVVWPVHPRLRAAIDLEGRVTDRVILVAPVSYREMAELLDACTAVFTDSGGLQKEAYFHRKPCVTLRAETEWPETIEAGWNRLWTSDNYLPRREIDEYGDGSAGCAIVEVMTAAT